MTLVGACRFQRHRCEEKGVSRVTQRGAVMAKGGAGMAQGGAGMARSGVSMAQGGTDVTQA